MASCSVDDLTDGILNGKEEHYQILNKCSGTLNVYEKYAAEVCRYEVNANQQAIESIEFMPDGQYVISKAYSNNNPYYTPKKELHLDVAGQTVAIPISMGKETTTRYGDYIEILTETGTYTYENDTYILKDHGFRVEDGVLFLNEYGESVAVRKSEKLPTNTLTSRLCHRWKLEEVLLKLYKDGKLVFSYQLPKSEMEEECVSDIVFTQYGTFLRYDEKYRAGTGKWNWTNITEQELRYVFNPPLYGENNLTAYFAGNNFYMTEELEAFNEEDDEEDDEGATLKAVCLYKMSVKGSN